MINTSVVIPWTIKSTLLVFLVQLSVANAESDYPFVPKGFEVPAILEAKHFRLRMLTVNDVVKDYDAVTSSAEHIQRVWPDSSWPMDLTLEQNLIDLGWHQKEFQRRRSFAYTVVSADESWVLGCVYINPTRKIGYDAVVYLWTRPPEQTSLVNEDKLRSTVRTWLKSHWPFENVAFPGTDISWESWERIAEVKR